MPCLLLAGDHTAFMESTPKLEIRRVETTLSYKDHGLPILLQAGVDFLNAILATALFRCWHIILFFAGWSTLITTLNHQGYGLIIDPTLLTVIGTVLGFVVSYRTTSSFERYNEGRRLWSSIIYATRNFARTVWFHVPDPKPAEDLSEEEKVKMCREIKAKTLVEKKTVINLLGAYAVAVKHYLRGEDGIYYEDLYHNVKFLSPYALPPGLPTAIDRKHSTAGDFTVSGAHAQRSSLELPQPVTAPRVRMSQSTVNEHGHLNYPTELTTFETKDFQARCDVDTRTRKKRVTLPRNEEEMLYPASVPPKYSLFDFFPFSLLIGYLAQRGYYKGRKAARLRARLQGMIVSHNLPLELSLYLSSYIAALQDRGVGDVPITTLLSALNLLVDSLTGLERILTTPIPFSYAIHLWSVTTIYCLLLPSMIWETLGWLTIPATMIICFFYYGFLVAGEEIENPFGYDKNDLDLDHFTDDIIKEELKAVTSVPPPDPSHWVFVPENDFLFAKEKNLERTAPNTWVERGPEEILRALSM